MEIEKIYDTWSSNQTDSEEIKVMWCKLEKYLYSQCSGSVQETIEEYVGELEHLIECQAFCAGYMQAFLLWKEILHMSE